MSLLKAFAPDLGMNRCDCYIWNDSEIMQRGEEAMYYIQVCLNNNQKKPHFFFYEIFNKTTTIYLEELRL